ncbi:MAG: TIGR01212 family radical SAM protein [Bacteroidales bacterium]|nr:TIGR01212 family radical SAM protein [Bacteroidales bacterium]
MTMKHAYNSFSQWLRRQYGTRVQKISINYPFSCPNRDGTKSNIGCIYCNNSSFLPEYTLNNLSITQQLTEGIRYFSKKYPTQLYIAYFQNYTNTYAATDKLFEIYKEACSHEKVVGLAIATRPDCINENIINILAEINKTKKVFVEIGIESTFNETLKLINRCHTFEDVEHAVKLLKKYNLWITGHLIFGLPYENIDSVIIHAKKLSTLQLTCLKLHQLQILKDTLLHKYYISDAIKVTPLSVDEYIHWIITFLEHLSPDIYIERFTSESPKDQVIAPNWNQIKNYHIAEIIRKKMNELNTYQGKNFLKE